MFDRQRQQMLVIPVTAFPLPFVEAVEPRKNYAFISAALRYR